ncbi:MAG: DUF5666 domain-containing protein [Desulfosarcinaceae bacterium]|nr:DUF5666 domain-containing protein [Desulfosarcinaceae bacterium]
MTATHRQDSNALSLLFILTAFVLVACGGGGGGGSSSDNTTSGSSALFTGPIEGFGSIILNGVRFDTDEAEFETEDSPTASQDDLRVGMVVTVQGTLSDDGTTGTAERVYYEDDVEGPITSVTASSNGFSKTITVLGWLVRIERDTTVFDDSDPGFTYEELDIDDVGAVVEVSGEPDAQGNLVATYIERKSTDASGYLADPEAEFEIKGVIENLDTGSETFRLAGLTVDFGNATLDDLENAPGGVLEDGLMVEVKGRDISGDVMTATWVEVKNRGLGDDDIDKVEVEGYVTGLDLVSQRFEIRGQAVDYAAAEFKGGSLMDLENDAHVEAEGRLSNGILVAFEVKFKATLKLEANVATYDATTGEIGLQGLPGILVQIDDILTRTDDDDDFDILSAGNHVEIKARQSNGILLAVRLKIEDTLPEDRITLEGPVSSANGSADTLTILGITVDTSGIENDDFEIEDVSVGREAFYTALEIGDRVEAEADIDLATETLSWREVEIELPDDDASDDGADDDDSSDDDLSDDDDDDGADDES